MVEKLVERSKGVLLVKMQLRFFKKNRTLAPNTEELQLFDVISGFL